MSLAILIAIAVILIVAVVVLARRARPDAVGDFQRQINALSPEARRPVVDQVHRLEETADEGNDTDPTEPRDGP
jgi:Sec-independent protein translocase protein TatA